MGNEIWEKNLAAMDKHYPVFADMLREKQYTEDDVEVQVEQSLDGETIFRVKKEEQLLYLGGRRDAKQPVEVWAEQFGEIHKYAAVFLFGIGSGAYLKAVMKKFPKEANLIVYEPSINIFLTLLREVDLSCEIEKHPIGFIVEGLNETEFDPVMRNSVVLENYKYMKEYVHPNYKNLFGEEIRKYVKKLQRYIEQMIVERNTWHTMSISTAQNMIGNLKYIAQGYHPQLMVNAFPHDGAAILVSAGPSLNKNIHELKRAKNKCLIVAVDTAIKPLMKAGIVPDLMATVDALKPLGLVDVEGSEEIHLVAPPAAVTALVEHQKGKKFFYFDGHALPMHLYSMNEKKFSDVAIGGSVACAGFSLIYKLGFDTIILVGQDLAYTGNRAYADGTFQDEMPEEATSRMTMVKGNCEEKVPTSEDLRIFLEWFEKYIKGMKQRRNVTVYNATEGGAYIEGTEVVTLKEILDQVCQGEEIDFAGRIRDLDSEFSPEELEKAMGYIKEIPGQLAEINKYGRELRKIYLRLQKQNKSKNLNQDAIEKLLRRIKKYTNKCMLIPAYELIEDSIALADSLVRSEQFDSADTMGDEIKEIARQGILYSDLLMECSSVLEEYAKEVLLSDEEK
ncbi:MAG: motility associated factor glycosyltransferase family protein [Lachnospiraceae bacterium]|nr:motility associated factor glycosyltransferase family protein [Lachnospiraceae bacterium]